MLKYFLAWFPMLLLAIINGTARDLGYKKYVGELPAHQISTITLCLLFGFYINFIVKKYPPVSETQALLIGGFWLVLTLGFEFGFGYYRGNSWEKLFGEYNLLAGKIWLLVPIWVAIAPYLFYKINSK